MPTRDETFLAVLEGGREADIHDMLLSGTVTVRERKPDPNVLRVALLKHVYLAQCLWSGIPQGPLADAVRAGLIAARDASRNESMPISAVALGLTVVRFLEEERLMSAANVAARIVLPDGPVEGVIMAGRLFVSWPAEPPPDVQLIENPVIEYTLEVGDRITGTILRKT
jgi:hypothetical protein